MEERHIPVRRPLWLGLGFIVAAVLLGAGIVVGLEKGTFGVDDALQSYFSEVRSPVLLWLSYALNWLGGGWFAFFVVPLGVAAVLLALRRPWAAAYFVAAEATCAVLVQVLKQLVGRARPEDMIVMSDFGSFPSGHAANAATVAVALFVIFPRTWVGVAGAVWTVLMALSRMYLGAHWLSDTLGGALIGAGVALALAAASAPLLQADLRRRDAARGRAPGVEPDTGRTPDAGP